MDVLLQVSKISLVDLAGSERADSTGAKGTRLKVRHTSLSPPQETLVLTGATLITVSTLFISPCFIAGRSKYQ